MSIHELKREEYDPEREGVFYLCKDYNCTLKMAKKTHMIPEEDPEGIEEILKISDSLDE